MINEKFLPLDGRTLERVYYLSLETLGRKVNDGNPEYYLYNAHGDVVQLTQADIISSDVYTIADGFIRKIEVGITVNELLENVTPAGGDIKVYKTLHS